MKKKKAPAFQFYAAEFLADENVMLMDDSQLGIYIRLICICWREGSIPSDIEVLKKLATKHPERFEADWEWIAPCFIPAKNNSQRLVHPRLEKERNKQKKFNDDQSKRAKKAWQTKLQRDTDGIPAAYPNDALHSSSSSSSSDIPPLPPKGKSGVDQFLDVYPPHRRVGQAAVKKYWARQNLDGVSAEIINAVKGFKKTEEWKKDAGRAVPNALKFLKEKRWADKPVSAKVSKIQVIRKAWKEGRIFRDLTTGALLPADELIPYNHQSGRGGIDDATAFKRRDEGDKYKHFCDFEVEISGGKSYA